MVGGRGMVCIGGSQVLFSGEMKSDGSRARHQVARVAGRCMCRYREGAIRLDKHAVCYM